MPTQTPSQTGPTGSAPDASGRDILNLAGYEVRDEFLTDASGDENEHGPFDQIITGTDGDDTLVSGDGNDLVVGGAGDDILISTGGNNRLEGGEGDDTLIGGPGDDTMIGGDGDDKFIIQDGYGNYTIIGGETGETEGDTIDASGMTQGVTLRYTDDEQGTIDGTGKTINFSEIENIRLGSGDDYVELEVAANGFVDGGDGHDILVLPDPEEGEDPPVVTITETSVKDDGTTSYTGHVIFSDGSKLEFKNFENIVCFTPGTLIDTDTGPRRVEDLAPGDRVLTRDHGYRELVWTGRKDLPAEAVAAWPELAPVRIAAGALGQGLPARDLVVSPRHRMLLAGPRAEVLFGEREVLVAAADLVGLPGIGRDAGGPVSYLHVMCEGHEIIRAESAWTESFQPAAVVLDALGEATRAELLRLFPELAHQAGTARTAAARPVLSPAEARLLVA